MALQTMVDRKRARVLNVRLLDAEADMLDRLAGHDGVTVSEWIRNTIRAQSLLAFGAPSPKKPKGKR